MYRSSVCHEEKESFQNNSPITFTPAPITGHPSDSVWTVYGQFFSNYLYFLTHAFSVRHHAFTLMPNHFHLLCSFPEENNAEALRYFMTETARAINTARKSINHVYGDRYQSTCITNPRHYAVCYRYVYQNPLRSRQTTGLSHYPYTTLSGLVSNRHLVVPIQSHEFGLDSLVPPLLEDQLSWMHQVQDEETTNHVRTALAKTVFKEPRAVGTGKPFLFNS